MELAWPFAMTLLYMTAALTALVVAGWILARLNRQAPTAQGAAKGAATALILGALWAMADVLLGGASLITQSLHSLSYLAWLWTLYRLFSQKDHNRNMGPIRPVVMALAFVELMQLALLAMQLSWTAQPVADWIVLRFAVTFRLLFCVGALVLVHNLYAGTARPVRGFLRWPAAALAVMWLYDLNLYTIAYLGNSLPQTLAELRGAAMLVMALLMAIGTLGKSDELRFQPSRSFAFQSFSLLVIGAYLVVMVLVAQTLAYAGNEFARTAQLAFVVIASALAITLVPSKKMRGWLRVTLSKHLFQHRYDYRAEWLRFTDTIGRAGASASPLHERVVQAVADITDSPGGILLTPQDDGGLVLDARWQWPRIDVPGDAICCNGAHYFEQSQFIIDMDDLRSGQTEDIPSAACPDWLVSNQDAWAIVPLLHYEKLVGIVVLCRPPVARKLDWEDFDLLRVVGRQLASYLAEQSSQDALGEAQRFDEFNRRIAFVMHDIKNLASQLSLLARNAERHADKPQFRADMILTLRNSTDKLQALLARLGRYGTQGGEATEIVVLGELAGRIAARYKGQHEIVLVEREPVVVRANGDALEQALLHLVQNAIDASNPDGPVFIDIRTDGLQAVLEIVDSGSGMSPEFIRTRLFKPFHSSKAGGFGIGAFEARELIRSMGGRLDVESRENIGTRFLIRLPRADTAAMTSAIHSGAAEHNQRSGTA